MTPVFFVDSAKTDLLEIKSYVESQFGQAVWTQTYANIRKAVANIAHHPLMGSIPEELTTINQNRYRQVLAGNNRIIYEPRSDAIYIHLVCDARRDLQTLLMRRIMAV